ncbi:unnamed protein product [Orchesella dallaii]|uniref:Uncharacterized protein n=1 Tax=Orchesella dallaii TaxID=48710 RepID=A0ABP1QMU0_9HEXA
MDFEFKIRRAVSLQGPLPPLILTTRLSKSLPNVSFESGCGCSKKSSQRQKILKKTWDRMKNMIGVESVKKRVPERVIDNESERIRRNYALLQKRLSEELHARMSECKDKHHDNLSDDFRKRLMQWEMWKASTGKAQYTEEEILQIIPSEFGKKLIEWEWMKEGRKVCEDVGTLDWVEKNLEELRNEKRNLISRLRVINERENRLVRIRNALKHPPDGIWIKTPTGKCRVEKLTDEFAKKIYEWEEKRCVRAEFSTIALLDPKYYEHDKREAHSSRESVCSEDYEYQAGVRKSSSRSLTSEDEEEESIRKRVFKDAEAQTDVVLRAQAVVVEEDKENSSVFVKTNRTIFAPVHEQQMNSWKTTVVKQEQKDRERPTINSYRPQPKTQLTHKFPKRGGKIPVWCSPLVARKQFACDQDYTIDSFLQKSSLLSQAARGSGGAASLQDTHQDTSNRLQLPRKYTIGGGFPPGGSLLSRSNSFGFGRKSNALRVEPESSIGSTVSVCSVSKSKSTGSISRKFGRVLFGLVGRRDSVKGVDDRGLGDKSPMQ